ncbi:hypothetical protein KC909_02815 [Candidatus Dojkabacteria bacterium]|uniref:Uncharacterized protein n=1 Tax=Candidatus Dojkabacteria bacterium TaxID=2099670 RepID=A0A955L5A5_9BACT|nr:hypothetical protein [Candidatus Dojkabacteria bacterium]
MADGTNLAPGAPVCVSAGADTCDLRASIYSDPAGGTLLWQETHSNVELGDYEGVFNLQLNSVCASWEAPGGSCSGSGIDWGADSTVYLEIQFDDDGNGDFASPETFTRSLFNSVPYAYQADSISGGLDTVYADDSDKVLGINDAAGLVFDLTTTGDFIIAENGTPYFTFKEDNQVTYSADDATDVFDIAIGNFRIGSGGTPGLALDGEDAYIEGTLEVDSAVDFGANVNFNNNQALGFRIENLASAPTCNSSFNGKLYHNTVDTYSYVCDGSSWQRIDAQGASVVLGEFYDNVGGQDVNIAAPGASVAWGSEVRKDTGITHSTSVNNSRVTLDNPGWYKVSYSISHENQTAGRKNVRCLIRLDGTTSITASDSYSYSRNTTDEMATNNGTAIFQTSSAGQYYEIMCYGVGSNVGSASALTLTNQSWTFVEKIGGSPSSIIDLDAAYDNDSDKILNVDNSSGLEFISSTTGNIVFDLQSTGDFIIEDTGNNYFTVTDSGNIGIRTTNPQSALDINLAGSAATAALIFENDSDTGIFHPAANVLGVTAGGVEQFRVTGNGINLASKVADPGTPVEGDVWFRSDTDNINTYNDGRVQEIQTVAVAQVYESILTSYAGTPVAITFEGTSANLRTVDATYAHSTVLNSSRLTINDSGYYQISYSISNITTNNQARVTRCELYVNGAQPTPNVGVSYAYMNNSTYDEGTNTATVNYSFTGGDYIEVYCQNISSAAFINTIANESWLNVELIRRQ